MAKTHLDELLQRLQELQGELEQEADRLLSEKRAQFNYSLRRGRVQFEQGMRVLQKHQRLGLWRYIRGAALGHLLTAPIIYSLILPLLLLDLMAWVYQRTCFQAYGIPRVRRADYILIDRQHLAYLNAIERINCVYCGYGNGLLAYMREITARTEQYWCPIKHARRSPDPHRLANDFVDYGDAENYRRRLAELRSQVQQLKSDLRAGPADNV
jgi:polyhydroxyalkanoate synthesis regulator phasin